MGGMRREWTTSEQGRSEALQRGELDKSLNSRIDEEEKEEAIQWYEG